MKVIAFLKATDQEASDELMVQITHEEYERIMGLEGKDVRSNISRMAGKTLVLPDIFGELTWMKRNKKRLRDTRGVMLEMAEKIKTLLPEEE